MVTRQIQNVHYQVNTRYVTSSELFEYFRILIAPPLPRSILFLDN